MFLVHKMHEYYLIVKMFNPTCLPYHGRLDRPPDKGVAFYI
jgi:hypothetical protein